MFVGSSYTGALTQEQIIQLAAGVPKESKLQSPKTTALPQRKSRKRKSKPKLEVESTAKRICIKQVDPPKDDQLPVDNEPVISVAKSQKNKEAKASNKKRLKKQEEDKRQRERNAEAERLRKMIENGKRKLASLKKNKKIYEERIKNLSKSAEDLKKEDTNLAEEVQELRNMMRKRKNKIDDINSKIDSIKQLNQEYEKLCNIWKEQNPGKPLPSLESDEEAE